MRILTLDTGAVFGWAFGDPFKDMVPYSGSYHLPEGVAPSRRFIGLEQWLINFIKASEITDVYVEQNFIPAKTSFQAITVLAGYVLVSAMAATKCAAKVSTVELSTWRSELRLPTQGPKNVLSHPEYAHMAKNKGGLKDAKRQWVKDRAMDYARKHGCDPKDDNEGDATCMYLWKAARLRRRVEEIGTKRDLFQDIEI